jgi:short-subunit dehydrogenase
MKVLTGKTALVTGAASGIGHAITLRLARERMRLLLLDIDESGLMNVAGSVRELGSTAETFYCDLRDTDRISAVMSDILAAGGADIVVNNAGVGYCGPTHKMDAAQWDRILSINLLAPVQIIHELLPSLLARPEAHIVNVGSMLGLVGGPQAAAYSVSKFGLQGLSESLRAEYGRSGLGVTAVCPGFATTGIFAAAQRAGSLPLPKHLGAWLMTTPEHIADRTCAAIQQNRPLAVITPLAQVLWFCKRLAPSLFLQFFTKRYSPAPAPAPSALPVAAPLGYGVYGYRPTRALVPGAR